MSTKPIYISGKQYLTEHLHITTTMSANGYITKKTFYKNYDPGTQTYTNKRFEITNAFTNDATNGLPTQIDTTKKAFKGSNGSEIEVANESEVHYFDITSTEGAMAAYEKNIQATTRVLHKASMYLMGEVGVDNGKLFLRDRITEVNGYKDQDRQPLIDVFDGAGFDFTVAPYSKTAGESTTINATMKAILDISYI